MDDGPAFTHLVSEAIEEVCASHAVDRNRIRVVNCSNGGYMTLKMVVEKRRTYASAVPIVPL